MYNFRTGCFAKPEFKQMVASSFHFEISTLQILDRKFRMSQVFCTSFCNSQVSEALADKKDKYPVYFMSEDCF